jgi:hypothetical protein
VTQEYYRLQPTTIHNQSAIKIDEMAVITEKIEALLAKANPCSGAAPSIKTTGRQNTQLNGTLKLRLNTGCAKDREQSDSRGAHKFVKKTVVWSRETRWRAPGASS